MSWFDFLKRTRSSNREKLLEKVVTRDPTAGIQAHQPFYGSEILVNNLPPFHIRTGRLMLRSDPIVNFALNVRNAALMVAEVEITAKNEAVRKWVQKQWDTLWDKHRNKILATKAWGFQPLQLVFKYGSTGLPDIEDVKDFAPEDCRAQELGGKVCGFKIKDRKVFQPQALWMTFNSEYGSPYGTGCLRRQYPPWFEKWTSHGSKKLGQLRMIKDAYIGDIFWYPKDQLVEIPLSDGTTARMAWRDLVRELGENRLSGNAMYLPSVYDDKEHKLLDYTPPQDVPGASQVFEWEDRHNNDILRGADVPLEVIEAQENGGFSGRSIPFMVVLSVCTGELTEYVQAIDVVFRQVAWLIWGGDPEFEIKPKSLVESFAADASGSPMGGGAVGGQPGQRPPPQQQQPAQQTPQRQNLNGNGRQFHEHDEQFDEGPEPLESIAAIGSASARSRIRGAATRIRALKKNDLTPITTLGDLIEQEITALRRGLSSDLSASMLGGQLTGMADAWATIPAEAIQPIPSPAFLPPVPPDEPPPPSIASLLGPDEPTPNVTFPVVEDALEVLENAPAIARPDFRATAAAVKEGAFAITGDLTDSAVADVRDLLAENLASGADREAFVDTVIERLGEGGPLSEAHVENIFRTNVAAAMSDGQDRALKAPMVVEAFPYRAYYATSDTRVRKEHRALERLGLDGTNIYRADDPSFIKFRPPWDFQCLLPGTIIQGRIEVLLRSNYSGKAIEIITAAGKRLRVTVNHPILTVEGFAPAGSIKKGDNVLSYVGINDIGHGPHHAIDRAGVFHATYDPRRFSPHVHKQYCPTAVADVFASLALHRELCRFPIAADDLHGEARGGNGYVDVVWADWELTRDNYAERFQNFNQLNFTSPDSFASPSKTSGSDCNLSGIGLRGVSRSVPSGTALANDSGGVALDSPPLRQLCLGTAAYLDASRYEAAMQNTTGESDLASQFLQRYPRSVICDQVVKVCQFDYVGHVLDVQAAGGWLTGDGIIVSNCRCSWTPVTVEQAARRGVREAQEWLERAKAMAAELGGSEYQYFERTAPASPQWVTPPGFEPSPEFERR